MQRFKLIILVLLLASCSSRGEITLYAGAGEVAKIQRVFLSTTREISPMGFPSGARSADLIFGRFDVSVPPDRDVGSITWPGAGKADPKKHFLVDNFAPMGSRDHFVQALHDELAPRRDEARTVALFVHGFNNRFADGLYRFAQLHEDLKLPFLPVHYSWPSAGHPLGYGYDRDSMLFARDGLEDTIRALADAGAQNILLVAHSMGALLAMEALRQIAIADGSDGLKNISGVVLISPDIDLEVFKQQAKRIAKLPKPFYIFTSTHDVALRLSAGLSGKAERLGNTDNLESLSQFDITMIDISAFSDGALDHNTALASPSFLRLLQNVPNLAVAYGVDPATRTGLIPGTALVLQNATRLVVPNIRP